MVLLALLGSFAAACGSTTPPARTAGDTPATRPSSTGPATAPAPAQNGGLSPASRRIVASIAEPVTVTVYFSAEQPHPADADEAVLRDLLGAYASASDGKVFVRFQPVSMPAERDAARAAGCQSRALQSIDAAHESASITEAFRCVQFVSRANHEQIDFVPVGAGDMEYEFTSVLRRVAAPPHTTVVGFLTGHDEARLGTEFAYLAQLLEQSGVRATLREVDLHAGADAVPADVEELWIVRPRQPIGAREREQLDAYLGRGGSVAVVAAGISVPAPDPVQAEPSPVGHNLGEWLGAYGIRINADVLLDLRAPDGVVRYNGAVGRVRLATWPQFPAASGDALASEGGIDRDARLARGVLGPMLPYPSSLALDPAAARARGGELSVLAATGPHSIRRPDALDLNLLAINHNARALFENTATHGPFPVAATLRGALHAPGTSAPARAARVLVIASDHAFNVEALRIAAQLGGGVPDNLTLLFNAIPWLAADDALLDIPVRWTGTPRGD